MDKTGMVSASTVLMLRLWHKVLFVDQDWISNQVVCHKRQKGQLGKYWSSNGKWLDPFFPPSFILYTQTSLIWSMPRRAHGLVHFCCSHLIWSDTDISHYIQITRKPFLCLSCWPECPPIYCTLPSKPGKIPCNAAFTLALSEPKASWENCNVELYWALKTPENHIFADTVL